MIKEAYFLDFYNNLIEGEKEKCSLIIDDLLKQKTSVPQIYIDIYQRSLYMIGKLWEDGKITIAEEHLATAIIESLMDRHMSKLKTKPVQNKTALITCIDKEYHKIGAKMAADIFELNGWKTVFLGASTPTKEIVKFIRDKKPDVVGLSFNFYLNILRFLEVIDHIKRFFPDQRIVVGGQGIESDKINLLKKYPDIFNFKNVAELDSYLNSNGKQKHFSK